MKLFIASTALAAVSATTCFSSRMSNTWTAGDDCVPNSSVLTCNPDGFSVTLNLNDMYEDENALTDAQLTSTVTIGTCSGQFASGQVTIADTWEACGINPSHVGPEIVWESAVSSSSPDVTFNDANGSPITIWLTRTQDFTIRCAYPDTAEVNTEANIDVAALGAAGTVEGTGAAWDDQFAFDLFTDDSYSTTLAPGANIALGDTIYTGISGATLPAGIEWYVEYCRAAKDSGTTDTYVPLIEEFECKNDIFDIDLDGRASLAYSSPYKFEFHSFVFDEAGSNSDQLYLFCKMKICLAGEQCTTAQTTGVSCPADFTQN